MSGNQGNGLQFGFGAGLMYGIRTDLAGQTPIRFGAMQDISIEFNGEIKELYAQSQFAIDAARGKVKIMGKSKLAQISARAYNSIFFGGTLSDGTDQTVYNEAATTPAAVSVGALSAASIAGTTTLTYTAVPAGAVEGALVVDTTTPGAVAPGTTVVSATSTTVTISKPLLANTIIADSTSYYTPVVAANGGVSGADYVADLGVYYANSGQPLQYTTGIPTAATAEYPGTYTEVNGSYYFADLSTDILLNYLYTNDTSGYTLKVGNPLMGTTPKFMGVFTNSYEGLSLTMRLYACVASKLSFPTKIDDYTIPELDFSAYQNAAGQTVDIYAAT